MSKSRAVVERIIENEETVYGITTGFGLFSDVRIDPTQYNELQVNLIRSHACGLGEPFSKRSSISHDDFTIEYIIKRSFRCHFRISETITIFINERIIPIIPQQGSLGASGDLAPLSHLALALIGEGKVLYRGKKRIVTMY